MCNYGSALCKTLIPKEFSNLLPILSRYYSMKVKAHKLQYEMRKLKERDERKRTLDMRIYPVVQIATKAPLRPRC